MPTILFQSTKNNMNMIKAVFSFALLSIAAAILPNKCSVEHCGTVGASARCTQTQPFKVTTCASWAKTREAIWQCRELDCSGMSCYFIPLLASDGNLYCTPCHIHQVACKTGFKVFGPVDGPISRQYAEKEPAEELHEEDEEITKHLERKTVLIPFCSMTFCTKRGANALCLLDLTNGGTQQTTCFKFSFTPKSKKQCRFFCPLFCLPEDQQPVANTGKKFCNECLLRAESCRTNYKTFGPVPHGTVPPPTVTITIPTTKPLSPTCSVKSCTMSGRNGSCLLDRSPSTCAEYAKTEEKKRDCDFACIQICVPEEKQPVDNFGKKYCSLCHLSLASCASDFKVFRTK